MQPLPETLPEDFSEWDSGYSAAAQSVNFSGSAAAVGDISATKPPSQSENPQYTFLAELDGSNDFPRFTAGSFNAADESLLWSFRLKGAKEISPNRATNKRIIVTALAAASILLLLAFVPGLRLRLARVKQSIGILSTSADKGLAANTPKPSPSMPLTADAQSSTIAPNPLPSAKSAAGANPATDNSQEVTPPPVESKMMTDQLTAPTQIPHEIKTVTPDEAPPASGTGGAGVEGLDSSGANLVRSVLSVGNNGPTVSPEPVKVTISSGVAEGMFLHGAKPLYPALAKSAHLSGTVMLQATISKQGTIENLRVNSGQAMLRPAAMDAVSTWRYKPYLLNGQPVEIDTTIKVVFTAPGE